MTEMVGFATFRPHAKALAVMPAGVLDRDVGRWTLAEARRRLPRGREVFVDAGFSGRLVEFVRRVCEVYAKRWVGKRAFAWLSRHRRLRLKDEEPPDGSKAMIHAAMMGLMLRRLHIG